MAHPELLKDTVDDMVCDDYKARFFAEFWQTYIRYEKLKNFCDKIEAAERTGKTPCPQHDVPLDILREQQKHMGRYLHTLQLRAIIEKIDLRLDIVSNDTVFQ